MPVDDHRVVVFAGGQHQALLAVPGVVHRVALLSQALDEVACHLTIVFDDQYSHSLLAWREARSPGLSAPQSPPQLPSRGHEGN